MLFLLGAVKSAKQGVRSFMVTEHDLGATPGNEPERLSVIVLFNVAEAENS